MVGTDEACIASENALIRLGMDLSGCVSNHEGAPLADGDAWRGNFDLYRHRVFPSSSFAVAPTDRRSALDGAPSPPSIFSGRQINSYIPGAIPERLRPSIIQMPASSRA